VCVCVCVCVINTYPKIRVIKKDSDTFLYSEFRIQIGMFRPIRVDHTNCLQVAIKTHSSLFYYHSKISVVQSNRSCDLKIYPIAHENDVEKKKGLLFQTTFHSFETSYSIFSCFPRSLSSMFCLSGTLGVSSLELYRLLYSS
jgi:hypothetical protein